MARRSLRVTGHTEAPPEVVWPLVGEAARWKEWAGLTTAELERPGRPDPDGVGAVRRFLVGPAGSREEVLAWEPPRHLAYTILRGFPVRDYRADVVIDADDRGGSVVTWSASFDDKVPVGGALVRMVLEAVIGRFVRRLCAHAAQAPPAG